MNPAYNNKCKYCGKPIPQTDRACGKCINEQAEIREQERERAYIDAGLEKLQLYANFTVLEDD